MPRGRRELPEECAARLLVADLIVHAGDWSGAAVLDRFEEMGPPLVAVRGNVEDAEVRRRLPERATFRLGGHEIAVIHDAGPRRGRLTRLRRRFPEASAVIFGHSHLPLLERDGSGFQIFNPGSPTERRRAPSHTMGTLDLDGRGELDFRLIEV